MKTQRKNKKLTPVHAGHAKKILKEIRGMKKNSKGKLSTSDAKKARKLLRSIRSMVGMGDQTKMF